MHAITQVMQGVVFQNVTVGIVDVDAITGMTDLVSRDESAGCPEQVNPVSSILRAHAVIAPKPIV
ncbi:hypothetical protein D3C78_1626190 [compost metagenome]